MGIRVASKPWVRPILYVYAHLFGDLYLKNLLGPEYLGDFMYSYLGDICSTPETTVNFLTLFQMLDAHSVYHHLAEIEQPALIISGFFDTVTPMYHSQEMARMMPHAKHVISFMSSHATLLEHPTLVVEEVAEFLATSEQKYVRRSSSSFGLVHH